MLKRIENDVFRLLESRTLICRFCLHKLHETTKTYSILENNMPHILSFCCGNMAVTNSSMLPETICAKCHSSLQDTYRFLNKVNSSQNILEKYLKRQDALLVINDTLDEPTTNDFEINECLGPKKIRKPLKRTSGNKGNIEGRQRKKISQKTYDCSSCKKRYRSNFELKVHLRTHTGEKPFTCSVCGKTFTDNRNLRRHEKIHSGNKEHECSICRRKFLHFFSLKAHERTHNGEKPYICAVCGKCFNTSGELTVHCRIHTKEKPYSCSVCQKAFSSKGTLNIHTRGHTGEKRHCCQICPRKCRTTSDLKVHMRCHNNEKPYFCKYVNCDKHYRNSSQLNVHLRTHTGEKPHQCTVCLKKFGESNTLKRHMITHGKDN